MGDYRNALWVLCKEILDKIEDPTIGLEVIKKLVEAIPTTPELEADASKRYDAILLQLVTMSSDFWKGEWEVEWNTNPVTLNVASADETVLPTHEIAELLYPNEGAALGRRVVLLSSIIGAAQVAGVHHIGVKVQINVNDAGWNTILNLTESPPLALAADGTMAALALPIDISALVESGVDLKMRFTVDSDNAGSVNYTTSFVVVLVWRMG